MCYWLLLSHWSHDMNIESRQMTYRVLAAAAVTTKQDSYQNFKLFKLVSLLFQFASVYYIVSN